MTRLEFPSAILRLVAVIRLAVVGMHAFAPIGTPLERRVGSAFSAATHDVSLTGKRKVVFRAECEAPDGDRSADVVHPVAPPMLSRPVTVLVAPVSPAPLSPASGRAVAIGPFGPRGPPLR